MAAWRCPVCLISWPRTNDFTTCPECGGKTDNSSDEKPVDLAEAMSRKRNAEFERYYEQREHKRLADEKALLKRAAE